MIERDAITTVIDILKPEHFYHPDHKKVYNAILDLYNSNSPIDITTVIEQLKKNGSLAAVGGEFFVQSLTERVLSAANIEYHSFLIIECSIKRQLISVAGVIETAAFDERTDVFTLLDDAEKKIFNITSNTIKRNYVDMKTIMRETIADIEAKKDNRSGITGIPSGFEVLDSLTAGWQPSDLIIVAARPGMGKTAFMLSLMRYASVEKNIPVAMFSLEMSSSQLMTRLISAESELESDKIRKGHLEDYELEQIKIKTQKISKAPIYIDDTPALSVFELRTKCRKLKLQHDVQLIIVDYLQLLTTDTNRNTFNREQEIAHISRSLKSLAKELNVPIITPSQLSRAVEIRGGDKRPVLSDLRESGAIEQDADIVMFLYRPDYYGITEDELGNNLSGVTEVIVAKHRNGPLGTALLRFVGQYVKFDNIKK
ncbi:MAG: replicative DNA helicase [Cytophagales bacterium]|nr:replicative DNA helicase [Cytophagales bacterium]